jgi:hypothetical protein
MNTLQVIVNPCPPVYRLKRNVYKLVRQVGFVIEYMWFIGDYGTWPDGWTFTNRFCKDWSKKK